MMIVLLGCTQAQNITTPSQGQLDLSTDTDSAITPAKIPLNPSVTPFAKPPVTLTETVTTIPIALTIDPTYLNFATNTPTPTLNPDQFLLRIVSPGPMSKVVSPVELIVHIAPEYTGTTNIELIGEDGVKLVGKMGFKTYSNIGYYTRIDEKIEFEIRGAAEVARLQISTFDIRGHMQAFNSVRLLLQAVGENELTPSNAVQDRILLRYPIEGDEVGGSSMPVMGEFQPANDLPIVLELIDGDGVVLDSRLLQLGPADGKYQQFTTSIPFQVSKKTAVRLVIRQSDDRIEGLSYLFSRRLVLVP